MRATRPRSLRDNTVKAVQDLALRRAMKKATDTFTEKRTKGTGSIPFEEWRNRASEIRERTLNSLPEYLDRFCVNGTRSGAIIHRAADAQSAREIIYSVLMEHGVHRIVKAKSMVTEEIRLNRHLQDHGLHVVETDLGEYIVQLADEAPSHLLAPAIHKDREQVGRLFAEKLNVDYSDDPEILTKFARTALRNEFFAADAGITGANFAVADSGSLVIFTNEGNGRMVTTLPALHIAIFTIEKIIPSLSDLAPFIRLLPRSATGQSMSSYLSIITGARKAGEATGARELHIVLLDNGRSKILGGEYREILKCIRCSACFNVCPVYRVIGGHAYAATYPGPMGIVLTNLLEGIETAHPLLDASTLCGHCAEVCPVRVPLIDLIRQLRERRVNENFTPAVERSAMSAFGFAAASPALFRCSQNLWRFFWPVLRRWVKHGSPEMLPRPVKERFSGRM